MVVKSAPSQIKKYERKFGKIKFRAQAQELIDLARGSLEERREEFLRKLSKRVIIEETKDLIIFRIPERSGTNFAFARVYSHESYLELAQINIGEFTEDNSLRKLGVGTLMLDIIKNYAKRKKYKRIILECQVKKIEFYLKNGFKDLGNSNKSGTYHLMSYVIRQ